jgi:ABC-type multidrug transport system fused ATPase/permease subunit
MRERDDTRDEPAVRFDRVSLSYGPEADVLADVSLQLRAGSMTFLTGPSGAGKSSLLKLAYLALRPTAGRVSLFGIDTGKLNRPTLARLRGRIGVVFQEFRLLEHLTAYENVALPLRVNGDQEKRYRGDVIELLNWVGLGDRLDARPATLSGGEKQRVAIARTLLKNPPILLLDEATSALDTRTEQDILGTLHRVSEHRTTIAIAHRLSTIADADLIHVMDEGRIVEQGTHGQLLRLDGLYAEMWARQAAETGELDEAAE